MNKISGFISVALLAAVISGAAPARVQAEKWYDNKWVWGGTGLVVGGIIGNEIGKAHERRHQARYAAPYYAPAPYYYRQPGPYYYDGGPTLTGASYTEETRVWPFYRRTKVYPIASTTPAVYTPQNVSMAVPVANFDDMESNVYGEEPQAQRDLNINMGDNNSNVTINLNGAEVARVPGEEQPVEKVQNYPNSHPSSKRLSHRVVDSAHGGIVVRSSQQVGESASDSSTTVTPNRAERRNDSTDSGPVRVEKRDAHGLRIGVRPADESQAGQTRDENTVDY